MGLRGRDIIDAIGKKIDPDFDIDLNQYLLPLYQQLFTYTTGTNQELPNTKGLLLYGKEGTGKTMAINVVKELILKFGREERRFSIIRYENIVSEFREINNEIFEIYGNGRHRDVCFDDFLSIGNKQKSDFGNQQNLGDLLIKDRYNAFKDRGNLTHLTTNQDLQVLMEVMAPSSVDRMYEMFNFVNVSGVSLRKLKQSGDVK